MGKSLGELINKYESQGFSKAGWFSLKDDGDSATVRMLHKGAKAVPLCKKAECTFLMINQLRENIGNMYKPYKIPCGTAIAHACSQILWFTKGSLLDEKGDEKSSTYSDPVGSFCD